MRHLHSWKIYLQTAASCGRFQAIKGMDNDRDRTPIEIPCDRDPRAIVNPYRDPLNRAARFRISQSIDPTFTPDSK